MNILNISVLFSLLLVLGFPMNNGIQDSESSDLLAVTSVQKSFDFESCAVNSKPENWSVALTGDGKMCDWKVVDDAGNKVLAQVSSEKIESRFNLIVNDELRFKDVDIELKFKGVNGNYDQGGGPVWRYIDENNYYVARANPLENNYRVYKVENGRRIQLESARVTINTGEWYSLKVTMKGDKIKCYFNGKPELETTDSTFKKAGKVGLWTKSDAVTYFDDFKVN